MLLLKMKMFICYTLVESKRTKPKQRIKTLLYQEPKSLANCLISLLYKEEFIMPFKQINVNEQIVEKRKNDTEFDALWQESRNEYKLLAELVKIRKESNLSQTELAEKSGNKQQVISRIENKENSPTLKTLCSILDVLGYEIKFEPKQGV